MIYGWRFIYIPHDVIFLIKLHLIFNLFSVPIIPEFLYDIRHPDAPLSSFPKTPPPQHTTNGNEPDDYTTVAYGKLITLN